MNHHEPISQNLAMARFPKPPYGEIMNQILTIIRWTIIWNSLSLETCFPYLGRGQF